MKTLREYIDIVEGKVNEMDKTQSSSKDITDTMSPAEIKAHRQKEREEGKKALADTPDAVKKKLRLPPYDTE